MFDTSNLIPDNEELNDGESGASCLRGVANTLGGMGAAAAVVLSIGSLRILRSACFNFRAERSAFRAAAVVTAT